MAEQNAQHQFSGKDAPSSFIAVSKVDALKTSSFQEVSEWVKPFTEKCDSSVEVLKNWKLYGGLSCKAESFITYNNIWNNEAKNKKNIMR